MRKALLGTATIAALVVELTAAGARTTSCHSDSYLAAFSTGVFSVKTGTATSLPKLAELRAALAWLLTPLLVTAPLGSMTGSAVAPTVPGGLSACSWREIGSVRYFRKPSVRICDGAKEWECSGVI